LKSKAKEGREKRSDGPFGKTGISPLNPRGIVGKLGATRKFIILGWVVVWWKNEIERTFSAAPLRWMGAGSDHGS
jgi:hypothetical protein